MRVKIIIFAVMLLLCNLAYGQVTKDAYEKAVDYMNCKTVELSVKINSESKDGDGNINPKYREIYENYLKEFPCDEDVSSKKIAAYLNAVDYNYSIKLSQEIETLKSSYKQDWKPDEAATFLSNEVMNGKGNYKMLADFANKRKDHPDFTAFKRDLNKNLMALLFVEPSANVNSDVNSNTKEFPGVDSIPAPMPNDESWFDLTHLILIIAFLLFASATATYGIFFQTKLRALSEKLESLYNLHKSIDRKISTLNYPQKATVKNIITPTLSEIDKLKNEIDELKREVELKAVLKVKINELKNEVELLKNRLKEDGLTSEVISQRRQESQIFVEPHREVFYFSTPNQDGSFNEKSAHSTYREGSTIYRFIKKSSTEAEFQIAERETSVKLALEYPDKNIDPVCEAQNAYNPRAGQIVTVQGGLGKAVLDGDKWKVTKKAKIRYEH